MLFPKNRLHFTRTYKGQEDAEGWIVLDLAALDLEGANKVYLPVADIEKLKAGGDKTAERLKQARALLGGDDEA